jgi:hypothetical protein
MKRLAFNTKAGCAPHFIKMDSYIDVLLMSVLQPEWAEREAGATEGVEILCLIYLAITNG